MATSHDHGDSFCSYSSKTGSIPSWNGRRPFPSTDEKTVNEEGLGTVEFQTNYETLMDKFDELSETELDELLQDTLELNSRLKAFEKESMVKNNYYRRNTSRRMCVSGESSAEKPFHFLPPLKSSRSHLVAQENIVKGTAHSTNPYRVHTGREKATAM